MNPSNLPASSIKKVNGSPITILVTKSAVLMIVLFGTSRSLKSVVNASPSVLDVRNKHTFRIMSNTIRAHVIHEGVNTTTHLVPSVVNPPGIINICMNKPILIITDVYAACPFDDIM